MSITPETLIKVTNRSFGTVVYNIPERHIRKEFAPKETKSITFDEIVAVVNQAGGRELFYDYLLIQDEEALRSALNIQEEPEYWLTNEKIPTWLTTCPLAEFKDALDFAPQGVKDLIKSYAVSLPLNDVAKRSAIKLQLGFDVDKALELTNEEGANMEATTVNKRRASTPDYKVVAVSSK